MRNPYSILGIPQDATKIEIQKAAMKKQREIMKSKEITPQELMKIKKQLLSPEKRLIADFLFPKKIKGKRSKVCKISHLNLPSVNVIKINPDEFDSLI